jgi:hypothetical protein
MCEINIQELEIETENNASINLYIEKNLIVFKDKCL